MKCNFVPLHDGDAEFPGFPAVSLGEWHFVALAIDRSYMTFVFDGGDVGAGSFDSR